MGKEYSAEELVGKTFFITMIGTGLFGCSRGGPGFSAPLIRGTPQ
jgi:hypothetical protein